jgi:hypothetical protein
MLYRVLRANLLRLPELCFEPLDHLAAWLFAAPLRGHEIGVVVGFGRRVEGEVDNVASDDRREQFMVLKSRLVALEKIGVLTWSQTPEFCIS